MNIRTNTIMQQVLNRREHDFVRESVILPFGLQEVLDAGFVNVSGCVLLRAFVGDTSGLRIESDYDKTEQEYDVNNVHIDSYMSSPDDEFQYLKVGLAFAKGIYVKLGSDYRLDCRILVSFSETEYDGGKIDVYGGCHVRIYTVRPGCDDKFRSGDLNKFEREAVLDIE